MVENRVDGRNAAHLGRVVQTDTRNKWLCHLREAQRLLDLAEEREIG